jgi:hypothetical protein
MQLLSAANSATFMPDFATAGERLAKNDESSDDFDQKSTSVSEVQELDDVDPNAGPQSKFKAIFGLLTKMVGVKDFVNL